MKKRNTFRERGTNKKKGSDFTSINESIGIATTDWFRFNDRECDVIRRRLGCHRHLRRSIIILINCFRQGLRIYAYVSLITHRMQAGDVLQWCFVKKDLRSQEFFYYRFQRGIFWIRFRDLFAWCNQAMRTSTGILVGLSLTENTRNRKSYFISWGLSSCPARLPLSGKRKLSIK